MESLVKYLLLRPAQRRWDTTPLRVIKFICSPPLIPHAIRVFSKEDESVPTRPRGKSNFSCYIDPATENRLKEEVHVSEASNVLLAMTAFSWGDTESRFQRQPDSVRRAWHGTSALLPTGQEDSSGPDAGAAATTAPRLVPTDLCPQPEPARPPGPHCPQLLTEPTPV